MVGTLVTIQLLFFLAVGWRMSEGGFSRYDARMVWGELCRKNPTLDCPDIVKEF